nr:MAG: replication initiator protein [Microvirus sp.]
MDSKHTYFGLLTYAEVGQKLEKRDVQLFLKRLRSYNYKLSYLICGEHGEKKGRPHWHCLFFTNNPIHYAAIAKAWRGGYETDEGRNKAGWIRFEPIKSAKSIRYTVKYIYKYDGKDPRFSLLISKNPAIGKSFLRYQNYCLEKQSADFTILGKKMAMPRYYKRKIFDDYPDIKEIVNAKLADKVEQMLAEEINYYHSLYPNLNGNEILNLITNLKLKKNEHERNKQFGRSENYIGSNI